jgi:membrane-associated HD superfamily phosphohydrolase
VIASLFVHATGIAALSLSVTSSIHRCDHRLRRQSVLAGILWAVNYFLLGATLGAALSCVSAVRTSTASMVHKKHRRIRIWACALFVSISLITAVVNWQDWTTLLPIAASILTTYAVFFLSGTLLRFSILLAALLWTQNALSLHSPEQILCNFLGIAATVGLWRAHLSTQSQPLLPG